MFIGVTGHQDIPETASLFIKEAITEILGRYDGKVTGVSSLAAGADQVFAEILIQMHGSLHVVVPSQNYEAAFNSESALASYKRLLEQADFIETCQYSFPSEEAYFEAGRRVIALSDLLIAVWDGKQAKGEGGTADIVDYAHECKTTVVVVWPEGTSR